MRQPSLAWVLLLACLYPGFSFASPDEANRFDEVRRILRQASELVDSVPELQQSNTAADIAGTQASIGDLEGALRTALRLRNPNDQAWAMTAIAVGVDYAGNPDGALDLVAARDSYSKNSSYESLAYAHTRGGDFDGALRIAHMIDHDPNRLCQVLTNLAKTEWKAGDHTAAQRAFDKAATVAQQAGKDSPAPLVQLPGIAAAQNVSGDTTAILLLGIAAAQNEVGDTEAAFATMDRSAALIHQNKDPVAKGNLLSILALHLAQMDEIDRAERILDEVAPGTNCDAVLQTISYRMAKSGDMRGAVATVSRMSDAQRKALAMRELVAFQGESGNSPAAVATANEIPAGPGRAYALSTLALQQAEKDDDAAWRTVQLALDAAHSSTSNMPTNVFEEIAVTKGLLGDLDGALEIVRSLGPEGRVWPLQNITSIMAAQGKSADALELAAHEDSPHPKLCALLGTARGMLKLIREESKERSPRQ